MPAVVINHLHFREAPNPELFARAEQEVVPQAREIEGFRALHIVQAAPDHFI
jgi:heme-degrading monooxygenase HmoA